MNLLTKAEMQNLSFPDYKIENMKFDIPNRIMEIMTNGGYLSLNGGIRLKSCRLVVKNWESIEAKLYRTQTKQWENLDASDIEKLMDICEFECGEKIIFRGFGAKTGQWIEFIFSKAILEVEKVNE